MKIPEFTATGSVVDLADWYKKLGWNPDTHSIDPTKVKMSFETNKSLMTMFADAFGDGDDRLQGLLLWMQYGPSVKDIPDNEVVLEDGWLIPD
jgi:hypothetical protein